MTADPISEFIQESRLEKERASVDFRKASGEVGFHLRAKGGRKAIEKLVKKLNEAI